MDAVELEKKLSAEISVVRNNYQEVTDVTTVAEADKAEARRDYENFLGCGNEVGMSGALRRIREADAKVKGLPNQREEFFVRFRNLEDQYKDLMGLEQQHFKEVKAVLDQAQKDFEGVERRNTRVRGIQKILADLKSLIINSNQAKAVVPGGAKI